MKICKKCIMLDTRPRLKFNDNGICAACEWDKIKKVRLTGRRGTKSWQTYATRFAVNRNMIVLFRPAGVKTLRMLRIR